jgi:NAD(P)-dependent dehydrogenase (short-subunit alcohol dehydrogenase family)
METMVDFKDKAVLITGAAGSLGEATAVAFYRAGASLALADLKRETVAQRFTETINEGARALYLEGDLTNETSATAVVAATVEKYGRLDVLINIAGGFTMGSPLHETDLKDWEFMLNLNAKSVFLMSRAAIPHMLAAGKGKIVNIGARPGLEGKAKMAPYSVAKSAVIRLTESMAAELKADQINVNCILPGTIDTPQNRADMPDADFRKWVAPAALADVILFLASEEARAVHGAAVPVYGLS